MRIQRLSIILVRAFRAKGLSGILRAVIRRVFPVKSRIFPLCKELVQNGRGIEIGGPSWIFSRKGSLPVYPLVVELDNCNFARKTVWEGAIAEGKTFVFDKNRPAGRQYIGEAVDLGMISTGTYSFLLSCHTIEHTADPLRAINEWIRILQPEGKLLLVVPHMEGTFDHKRPVTDLNHLIEDFRAQTKENDQTHLSEVLELHDLDRDLGTPDFATFKERSERNLEFRCLHHHVFDTALVVALLDHAKLQILAVEVIAPFHIIVAAQKIPAGATPINQQFLSLSAEWRRTSPFQRDRVEGPVR